MAPAGYRLGAAGVPRGGAGLVPADMALLRRFLQKRGRHHATASLFDGFVDPW